MARLKVFTTMQGFHETAVAASSQAQALEAWGTRQNLFAEGLARVTTEAAVVAAAMAHPGQVVRRPAQSAADLKAAMDAPKPARAAKAKLETLARAAAAPPEAPTWTPVKAEKVEPPPDRSRLEAMQTALDAFERQRAAAARAAAKERQALETRLAREEATLGREGLKLKAAVAKARAAYERD